MRLLPLVILLALTPAALLAEAATETPAPPPPPPPPAISVTTVTRQPLVEQLFLSGLVAAVEEIRVQPLIEGQPIEALLADVGDLVGEGEVLARLSGTTLELQKAQAEASRAAALAGIAQAEAQILEAENMAAEATRVAERLRRLRAQGTAPEASLDTAEANAASASARLSGARQGLEAARAQLALAEAQLANTDLMLARTEVKAPHAGRITARNAVIGAIASGAGQPMFVLERDAALELRAEVSEGDLLRLAPGQAVALTVPGRADPLQGEVRLVEPVIDSASRLGLVRIAIAEPDAVRAGMFASAAVVLKTAEELSLPVTAFAGTSGAVTVLKVDADGQVSRAEVQTGIRSGGVQGVISGLAEGDRVVSRAGAFVRPGDRITPVEDTN